MTTAQIQRIENQARRLRFAAQFLGVVAAAALIEIAGGSSFAP